MYKVGIIGGTGYTGSELSRVLCIHPEVELAALTSRQNAGKKVSDVQT
ncbi:MAG: N-acetyl-gamma-glutamyl-phosphate reductase, partial [Methanomassiliicoccaceae archaeon]|nr:N-acetyl-gamma-glutamyl-phosphate reductase [Methanomassiliicoccaceae archaeon]